MRKRETARQNQRKVSTIKSAESPKKEKLICEELRFLSAGLEKNIGGGLKIEQNAMEGCKRG